MPDKECEFCGKTENLVNLGGLYYCVGWCLDQAKEDARINAEDADKESRRLESGRKW